MATPFHSLNSEGRRAFVELGDLIYIYICQMETSLATGTSISCRDRCGWDRCLCRLIILLNKTLGSWKRVRSNNPCPVQATFAPQASLTQFSAFASHPTGRQGRHKPANSTDPYLLEPSKRLVQAALSHWLSKAARILQVPDRRAQWTCSSCGT